MGDDTPLAVLSKKYRGLQHYFPPEFQPGYQSAHRFPARAPRNEPQSRASAMTGIFSRFDEFAQRHTLRTAESPILLEP